MATIEINTLEAQKLDTFIDQIPYDELTVENFEKNKLGIDIDAESFIKIVVLIKSRVKESMQKIRWRRRIKIWLEKEGYDGTKLNLRYFYFRDEEERKLFDARVQFQNRFQSQGRLLPLVACFCGTYDAVTYFYTDEPRSESYERYLSKLSGIERARLYVTAGKIHLNTLEAGGFIRTPIQKPVTNFSSLSASKFHIFEFFYPQDPYFRDYIREFADQFPDDDYSKAIKYHVKNDLKNFIEYSEEDRREFVDGLFSATRENVNRHVIAWNGRMNELPSSFMEIVNNMMSSEDTLEQVLKKMSDSLNLQRSCLPRNTRGRSPSPQSSGSISLRSLPNKKQKKFCRPYCKYSQSSHLSARSSSMTA